MGAEQRGQGAQLRNYVGEDMSDRILKDANGRKYINNESPPIEDEKDIEIARLRKALYYAPPQRKPLTDADIELAYREIWRDLSDGFSHTSVEWIEAGIRYAEKAHGIE